MWDPGWDCKLLRKYGIALAVPQPVPEPALAFESILSNRVSSLFSLGRPRPGKIAPHHPSAPCSTQHTRIDGLSMGIGENESTRAVGR